MLLTPKRHEESKKYGGGIVKEVCKSCIVTSFCQIPVMAGITQGTHSDVQMMVTDLLTGKTIRKCSLITLSRGYYGSKITVGMAISNFEIGGMFFFLFSRSVNTKYLTESINQ